MDRHVVIGTAGHVDHGKTALVKALTGVDTDRWEEEKRRGITIDLGFAPLDLGGGLAASIVDVPGHEDFIRNMLAGATGVDLALLVVAADEGVMPQTIEHTAILEFLAVRSGVVAVTKTDLVEPDWLALVLADVQERLQPTGIAWEPPVPVSAVTGAGLDRLRAALVRAAGRVRPRAADDLFRLPVDRVFSLPGAGTVLTGTVWSGSVAVGDEVWVAPGPVRARVRSVQVHGRPQPRAEPGRRAALALVGLDRQAARRGSVVVSDPAWRPTASLDVLLTLLPDARPLSARSQVRFHVGTSEVMARVVPAAQRIEPGSRDQPARLRLDKEILARWGDRGVLRAPSPPRTIGGCVVVDPFPPPRPRRPTGLADRAAEDPLRRVTALVRLAGTRGIRWPELTVRAGLTPEQARSLAATLPAEEVLRLGELLVPRAAAAAAERRLLEELARFHREHPMSAGAPLESVRRWVGHQELAGDLLARLEQQGTLVLEASVVRLAAHRPAVPPHLAGQAQDIARQLDQAGFEGRTTREIEATHPGVPVGEIVEFLVRQGTALKGAQERYYGRGKLEEAARIVVSALRARERASPSELRELLGVSRKYLIPILEWMDARGYTVRQGDERRIGPAAHQLERTGA